MNYRLSLITAPTVEPLLLREVKDHLRLPHDTHAEDAQLWIYMRAAREYIEGKYGIAGVVLATQTWDLILDQFPASDQITIPLYPLQQVASLKYTDSANLETTWAASNYTVDLDSEPGRIVLTYQNTWPSATLAPMNPIKVRFIAGYDPAGNVIPASPAITTRRKRLPETLKAALLLLVGHFYENREETTNENTAISRRLALGVDALVAGHTRPERYAV